MNSIVFVTQLDRSASLRRSEVMTLTQSDRVVLGSLLAPSAFSLSMMREAFKGLLLTTERSLPSSAGQRDVLELSDQRDSHLNGVSVAFIEEKASYNSVLEFENIRANSTSGTPRGLNAKMTNFSDISVMAVSNRSTIGETR